MGNCNTTEDVVNSSRDFKKFKQIMENNPTIKNNVLKYKDINQNTILHKVCNEGNLNCILYLLYCKMSLYDKNNECLTPINIIVKNDRVDIFRDVFKNYIVITSDQQSMLVSQIRTYLYSCVTYNCPRIGKYLISYAKDHIHTHLSYDNIFTEGDCEDTNHINNLITLSINKSYPTIYKDMTHIITNNFNEYLLYFIQSFSYKNDIATKYFDIFGETPLLKCTISVIHSATDYKMISFLVANGIPLNQKDIQGNQIINTLDTKSKQFQISIINLYSKQKYLYDDLKNGAGDTFMKQLSLSVNMNNFFSLLYAYSSLPLNYSEMVTINGYTGTFLHHQLSKNVVNIKIQNIPSIILGDESFDIKDSNGDDILNLIKKLSHISLPSLIYIHEFISDDNKIKIKDIIFSECTKELSSLGANIILNLNPTEEHLKKAILSKLTWGSSTQLNILLNHLAVDINWKYEDDLTLLMHAVKLYKLQAIKKIISHGSNLLEVSGDNKTAFNYAIEVNASTKIQNAVNPNPTKKNGKRSIYEHYIPRSSAPPEEGTNVVCKICLDNKIQIIYLPCKHALACNSCFNKLKEKDNTQCFMCKQKIEHVIDFNI